MTAAAVRSVADPRPVRGPVGRRALQVVLFLGGLLALGLIFGAEAHAVQAPVPSLPAAGTAVAHRAGAQDKAADAAAEPVDVPKAEASTGLPDASAPAPTHVQVPVAGPSGAPVAETHARPRAASTAAASTTSASRASAAAGATTSATTSVSTDSAMSVAVAGARSVVSTTRDTVRYLARPVGEAVEGVGTAVDGAAGVLPDVWALPARLLLPLAAVDPPADGRPGHGSTGSAGARAAAPAPAPRPVCGYTSEADQGRNFAALLRDTSASGTDGRVPAPRYGPAPERAPLDPRGGFVHPSTTEAHGPRGGEHHAVPFAGGASFGLIRGAGLPATVAPMRDRSGDILEFPG
ncbi:hypothetical protein [Streptomyces sp. NPDC058545]|uniref:hypothetical protein n=1 Tax=Streptomyces sp. NPDC058545 TaxID=3346544 RepID=UPI00365F8FF4